MPLPAFHFRVAIDGGGRDTSFTEVDGLVATLEVETVVEGGENRFVHRLPKPAARSNLVLKRGVAPLDSPLVSWCRETLESDLEKPIELRSLDVHLLDENAAPVRSWSVVNAFPLKWTVDSFVSTKNEAAIESIELAYAFLNRTK